MEYITNNYVILFPISIFYLILLITSIVGFWGDGNFNGFILVLILIVLTITTFILFEKL